jgi:anti-sigma B factor antagonist
VEFQLDLRDGRLRVAGDMTIYFAAVMKEQLLSGMQGSEAELLVDLSQTTELDTCGVQMLLMMQRMAAAEGRRLTLIEPSAAVRSVLALCGLEALCGKAKKAKKPKKVA